MSVPASPEHRPHTGIVAALLAIAITIVGVTAMQDYAFSLASQYLRVVGDQFVTIKYETLTLQRAAFADGHYLPIYGSSELYYGAPFRPTQVYDTQPTGFDAFGNGGLGTGDLLFLQTFGALGTALQGKKLVLSESPVYFYDPGGLSTALYAGNFSPEIAEGFLFDSPISLDLREAGARRMLDYPTTLSDQPLSRLAAQLLADPTPIHLLAYTALTPFGQIDAWILQLMDARSTIQFIGQHPEYAKIQSVTQAAPRFDWPELVAEGTNIMKQQSGDNPFGWPAAAFVTVQTDQTALLQQALIVYCGGRTNRNGAVYPEPVDFERNIVSSAEWTDLGLEIRTLQELGAQPLVYSLPMPGLFDDYTPLSAKARQTYYAKYRAFMAQFPGIPSVDFSAYDEDRYFLTDTSDHFSARGYVFADRVIDMHWHGQPGAQMQAAVNQLGQLVPPTGPPPPSPTYCNPAMINGS